MSLTVKKTGDFVKMPEGTHAARCYQVIDIGTQRIEYPHGSGDFKNQQKIVLSFESPDELMEDGQPFIIHQEYTASFGDKAKLRQHLESWRGKQFTKEELAGFYVGNLLTQACLITVVHRTSGTGNVYANVTNISAPVKGMVVPELVNPALKWEVGGDLSVLPEWIKNKALASLELSGGDMSQDYPPMSENPGAGLADADTGFDEPPF